MTAAPDPRGRTGSRARLRPMARSIFGLLAGFCLVLVLWVIAYAVLDGVWRSSFDANDNPAGVGVVVALVSITTVIALVGGLLAVRLAERSAMPHALFLAAMVGAANWSLSAKIGGSAPGWFPAAHSVLPMLAIVIAGWAVQRRRDIQPPTT